MGNRIGKAYKENNPPTVTFDEPNGAVFFLCPDETVLPPYNNPCPQIGVVVSETPVEYNDCVPCGAITQALIANYIENGPFPNAFTLSVSPSFENYLTSLSALQNLCNFTFQTNGNNAPSVAFEEENGASYYLCPNETVLPPFTEQITAVSGCLPCQDIEQALQTYYLENGSNAAPPTLNALYGVSPELAELNIDFSTYSAICGFTIDFDNNNLPIANWTNPTPSTSYFCLGTYTTAPDAGNLAYRYGFNGQERSDEVYGKGNLNTALFWEYYARLVRRWNLDPVVIQSESGFSVLGNNPIILKDPLGNVASTDVTKNEDGSFTVVDAKNDGDNNIYVVDNSIDKKRTGEVIGKTLQPFDFMQTIDKTGEFEFKPTDVEKQQLNFRLDKIQLQGKSYEKIGIQKFGYTNGEILVLEMNEYATKNFGNILDLAIASINGGPLDAKSHLGAYTPILYKTDENGIKYITTIRAVSNIAFGLNMKTFSVSPNFYPAQMRLVGAYNQYKNDGNGYNSDAPFYGEHDYSGTFIYFGYFGKYPKKYPDIK